MEVIIKISKSEKQVYGFTLFGQVAVFTRYSLWEKPEGKRKYIRVSNWDKYNERDSNVKEPEMSMFIKSAALDKIKEMARVKTWDEYKK